MNGGWIWNISRVKFNWKICWVSLNITIINDMMIKSPHDHWNHRAGVERRGTGFELRWCKLSVPLSYWFILFFNIKGIELIHLSSKTWWEEFRATYNAGISLVSNPSTSFATIILSHADIYKNYLVRWCIIVDVIWRTKIMIVLTWSGLRCWISNNI